MKDNKKTRQLERATLRPIFTAKITISPDLTFERKPEVMDGETIVPSYLSARETFGQTAKKGQKSPPGVDLFLFDGLEPSPPGQPLVADVEIKEKLVDGHKSYVYLRLTPPKSDASCELRIERLPPDMSGIGPDSKKYKEQLIDDPYTHTNGTIVLLRLM